MIAVHDVDGDIVKHFRSKERSFVDQGLLKNRTTQRSVAAALEIPQPTLFQNFKNLGLHASSRYIKPLLTGLGQLRLEWALRWIKHVSGGVHNSHHFEDFIHLDEKWFYIVMNG